MLGPTWFTAAIYLTLSKISVFHRLCQKNKKKKILVKQLALARVIYLGFQYSRFSPKLYLWIFIPCDVLSLVLQAVGGALSSTSVGGSQSAIDVSIVGLAFQVFTLCVFIALVIEYAIRYVRASKS